MKNLLLLTLSLISSVCLGQDGVNPSDQISIICEYPKRLEFPLGISVGFRFTSNNVEWYGFTIGENFDVKVAKLLNSPVSDINEDYIRFWKEESDFALNVVDGKYEIEKGNYESFYQLDRQDLVVAYIQYKDGVFDSSKSSLPCRLMSDVSEFDREMEQVINTWEKGLRDYLSVNSISRQELTMLMVQSIFEFLKEEISEPNL